MKNAGEYVDSPEIIARKIKAVVIVNKKAVEFHQADTSDCNDSDASSYIELYKNFDIPDPELMKISHVFKALPNSPCSTVSQMYDKLRYPCSKVMKVCSRFNGLQRIPESLKVSKYAP